MAIKQEVRDAQRVWWASLPTEFAGGLTLGWNQITDEGRVFQVITASFADGNPVLVTSDATIVIKLQSGRRATVEILPS